MLIANRPRGQGGRPGKEEKDGKELEYSGLFFQLRHLSLNVLPHMSMQGEGELAERAGEGGALDQVSERVFCLPSTNGTGER